MCDAMKRKIIDMINSAQTPEDRMELKARFFVPLYGMDPDTFRKKMGLPLAEENLFSKMFPAAETGRFKQQSFGDSDGEAKNSGE